MSRRQREQQQDEHQGTSRKKLRSTETDLRVIVGQDDDLKEFHYVGAVLAWQSMYVDTLLATPMKETQEGVIRFPDLQPETWEAMMRFLEPVEGRQMTHEDALRLAVPYDKYDFHGGRACCDLVLKERFQNVTKDIETLWQPDILEYLIEIFVIADAARLVKTEEATTDYFRRILVQKGPNGCVVLTEDMMKKLQPLIVQKKICICDDWTPEMIESPLFAKAFVDRAARQFETQQLKDSMRRVELSGTGDKSWDGKYAVRFTRGGTLYFVRSGVYITNAFGDWTVRRGNTAGSRSVVWKCPYSSNKALPPQSGWIPCISDYTGDDIKIKCVFNK